MSKIIIVNRFFHPDLSATSQMASGLAFALAESGKQVCIVTSPLGYEDPKARLPKQESVRGVDIHRVWTTRFGRSNLAGRAVDYMSFYVSAFLAILALARANDIVIAKTDPPLISFVAWIASRIKQARLVNWLQDLFPEIAEALEVLHRRPLISTARWLRNISLRGAKMNVAIGQIMQQLLVDIGVDPDRTTVIQNWADGDLIKPVGRERNGLREDWGLQGKFVVGYSGNMGRAHDFDTIIEAMTLLKDVENMVFLFIGGGAAKAKLEQALRERDITNYLFRPYQDSGILSESLSLADIHLVSLFPQLEGLIVPSKLYGIIAAGRPVIHVGDPDGEVGRLIAACNCGYAVPCGDAARLATLLRECMQNFEGTQVLGNKGRRYFEQHLGKRHAMVAWNRLLTEIARLENTAR